MSEWRFEMRHQMEQLQQVIEELAEPIEKRLAG